MPLRTHSACVPSALMALRDKYRELLRLRQEAMRCPEVDPRPALRKLSERFPGALREIDQLPLSSIQERLSVLDQVCDGGLEPPDWARYFVSYHGWMRASLRLKRICRGLALPSAVELAEQQYEPAGDEPGWERIGKKGLACILKPPGGRLNPWIFERVAEEHDITAEEVWRALFSVEPPEVPLRR